MLAILFIGHLVLLLRKTFRLFGIPNGISILIVANVPSRYKSYPNGYAIPVMLTCMLMKVFLLGNQLLYKRYVYFCHRIEEKRNRRQFIGQCADNLPSLPFHDIHLI
jgi:preprotein translocase subunit SecY